MRTLRILLPAPPDPARADAWALYDADGRVLTRGRGLPAEWPVAERREAVLAADAVRVASLVLPALARPRLVAAATYALEDRLATPAGEATIAVGERRPDGRVNAIVVAREFAQALIAVTPTISRAIAEPELVAEGVGWQWCESLDGGFVRTEDGSAFSVSRTADDALPPELVHALAQAKRDHRAPALVTAERPSNADLLAEWQRASDVPFGAGTPWRWEDAPRGRFAGATDLLAGVRRASLPAAPPVVRGYVRALALLIFALALHGVAMAGTWAWQRFELARSERALIPIAHEVGARDADGSNALQAIARIHAEARHRAGLPAPGDAMPVFARAAPALAALPGGALKTANWSGGAWTLDLAPLDDATLRTFASRLASAGLSSLQAKTASGVRARVSLSP